MSPESAINHHQPASRTRADLEGRLHCVAEHGSMVKGGDAGRQITIDGTGGWGYGSAHHRCIINQGPSSVKWEIPV